MIRTALSSFSTFAVTIGAREVAMLFASPTTKVERTGRRRIAVDAVFNGRYASGLAAA